MKQRADPGTAWAVVSRCAVLLRGGVPAVRVFAAIASDTGVSNVPDEPASVPAGAVSDAAADIASRLAAGESPAEALRARDGPDWRVAAVAWQLAEQSGAALAPALERLAFALGQLATLRERRAVLLSGPRATVRLVIALPPLALLLGALLGFNPLPVLLSGGGLAMLCVGILLLGLGLVWARSMTRAVDREDRVSGLEHELVWIALSGGVSPAVALVRAADAVDEMGAEWVGFDGFLANGPLRTAISAAEEVGVPIAPLLLEEASALRQRAHADLERAAERLGVRVLLPLGVCVLPAFVVLGVLPVVISMLGGL